MKPHEHEKEHPMRYRTHPKPGDRISEIGLGSAYLFEAGMEEGSRIGDTLKLMLEHVLEVPGDNTKEKLLTFVRSGSW